jgi:hypothetical protein
MKINVKNETKLQAELDKLQAKCNARTKSADDIQAIATQAEERLESMGFPKNARVGATCLSYEAGLPQSYKYQAETTLIGLERGVSGWFVIRLVRTIIWPKTPSTQTITLSEPQQSYLSAKLAKPFDF